jgi:hypothetical protein
MTSRGGHGRGDESEGGQLMRTHRRRRDQDCILTLICGEQSALWMTRRYPQQRLEIRLTPKSLAHMHHGT